MESYREILSRKEKKIKMSNNIEIIPTHAVEPNKAGLLLGTYQLGVKPKII
jgi:hypothetical protein